MDKFLNKTIRAVAVAVIVTLGLCLCLPGCVAASGQHAPSSTSAASATQSAPGASASAGEDDGSYAEGHLVESASTSADVSVVEDGTYTDRDSVALYIHLFGHVPSNYVTKTKARNAGWVNTKGNLWDVLPGKSIGGGGFYNDDGMMPDAPGREWFECDIDYEGGYRNAKRLVYSNDGLIYYTDDHYKTFERLY